MLNLYSRQLIVCLVSCILVSLLVGLFIKQDLLALSTSFNAIPEAANFTGASSGDQSVFNSKFDISTLPATASTTAAIVQFSSSVGSDSSLLVYDKYALSVNPFTLPTATVPLTSPGLHQFDLAPLVAAWRADATHNMGVVIKASGLEAQANINVTNLVLQITYLIPDTTAPLISNIEAHRLQNGGYYFSAVSNEPVIAYLEYGKTSSYSVKTDNNNFTDQISFELNSLQSGISYHYRFHIEDASGNKTITADATLVTAGVIAGVAKSTLANDSTIKLDASLQAPSDLKLEWSSAAKAAHLVWVASTNGGTRGYIIYRSDDSTGSFYELTRVNSSQISFDDNTVAPGQNVQYQVRAFSNSGVSIAITSHKLSIPLTSQAQVLGISDARFQIVLGLLTGALILIIAGLFIWRSSQRFIKWLQLPQPKVGLRNSLYDPESID